MIRNPCPHIWNATCIVNPVSYGPEDAQREYDVDEETNEAKWTDSDICNDDAKRVSNSRWVAVRKE